MTQHEARDPKNMRAVYIDATEGSAGLLAELPDGLMAGVHLAAGDPDAAALIERMGHAPIMINGHTSVSAEELQRLSPTLRTIVFLGTGASSYIDVTAAHELGIEVHVVRGYGDRSVAEHAFALMLAGAKQIARQHLALSQGQWRDSGGLELEGKTLGVVGAGAIGRKMLELGNGFGMKTVAWNRSPPEGEAFSAVRAFGCRFISLAELFEQADVISLHLALNEDTRGLIGSDLLARTKPTTILVNTARGAVLEEAALLQALDAHRLGHAALDVFDTEPLPSDSPLIGHRRITLTAHSAWNTPEAARNLMHQALEIVQRERERLSAES